MNDNVSDLLIRIKNAYLARHKSVSAPYFSQGEKIANVLLKEGYLAKIGAEKSKKGKNKILNIDLAYKNKEPAITEIKIISKAGLRVYLRSKKITKVLGGVGISLISTPEGVMTGEAAKKKNLGGEMICEIW